MSIDEIKNRLRSGDVTGAEAAAQELLAAEPDNVQALMLYGTCRQLQGDEATFRRIHDELAPKMTTVADSETQGLWRKYHVLWLLLIIGGLCAIAVFSCTQLYAGPRYSELKKEMEVQSRAESARAVEAMEKAKTGWKRKENRAD